jgi:hypothetical protein
MPHQWTDDEMNQTIDLHLAYRSNGTGRKQAIQQLAQKLNLTSNQVKQAVNAVGTLDPLDSRRYPKPSKRLEQLWKQRGFNNKLD